MLVALALVWARARVPDQAPPTREAFEERHRLCYDIYAAADNGAAYDLLASAFAGKELDHQYCVFAKAESQLAQALANVTVWDLQYQDFKVLAARGNSCTIYSKWMVTYILGHSQHSHVRVNAYEVVFELSKGPDGWRIVSSRILNENNLA
ncbi:MAG TPA: hypothetical protein VKX17_13230 [Planctomycetota bacterium]|nr:hypothetical protein [Planctomycetota bacterium]